MLNLILMSLLSFADPIRVAVIDTGFSLKYINKIPICDQILNKSFIDNTIDDTHGHGTNVTGLIYKNAGNKTEFCFLIYKALPGNSMYSNLAITQAIIDKADIINYSGGSSAFDVLESYLINDFIKNKKGIVVAAAGNNNTFLGPKNCNYFPACLSNEIAVIGNKSDSSNYGPSVDMVIDGNDKEAFGITLSGSSQSTAIFTGQLIKYWDKKRGAK